VVSLPREFSVAFDQDGGANITMKTGSPSVRIKDYFYAIDGVCPLGADRAVVFGDVGGSGTSVGVVDDTNPLHTDAALAFYPVMSPDQRWIAYEKFFPRQTELPSSDEYLLYDLSKTPEQNRQPGVGLDDNLDVGTAIYPPGWANQPGDNIGAPDNQRHGHVSDFYWSPESTTLAFADLLQGKVSLVLVDVGDSGTTRASVYPVNGIDPTSQCGLGGGVVSRIEFGPVQGADRLVFVDFHTGCTPQRLELHRDAFQSAKIENRVTEKPTRKAIKGDGR
jgi:hypothetical protein